MQMSMLSNQSPAHLLLEALAVLPTAGLIRPVLSQRSCRIPLSIVVRRQL